MAMNKLISTVKKEYYGLEFNEWNFFDDFIKLVSSLTVYVDDVK